MKTVAHTPAPWYAKPTAGNHDFLIYPEGPGSTIAIVKDFDEANAHLIAAAPELLELCQRSLRLLEEGIDDDLAEIAFATDLENAIAKATGHA